jgi:hypothetical protein
LFNGLSRVKGGCKSMQRKTLFFQAHLSPGFREPVVDKPS